MTTASPTFTIPVGSRSSVIVPVVGTNAVMLKLANGVLPLGLPITERMRPTGLNGVEEVSTSSEQTSVLVETVVTAMPATPECNRSFALMRTLATYGDGSAQVERTTGPPNVIELGVYVLPVPAVNVPVACSQIRSGCVPTNNT